MNKLLFLLLICCGMACNQDTKNTAVADSDPVYDRVEIMPRFPGCENEPANNKANCASTKMFKFIRESTNYPETAKEEKAEGRAVISFVVQKDGKITDATILKDPGMGMGEEAKRIIESMPTWVPGTQEGKKAKVRYILPVKFKL